MPPPRPPRQVQHAPDAPEQAPSPPTHQSRSELADGLRRRGFEVELREPRPASIFDTSVHIVAAAVALRVAERPDAGQLREIERSVRIVLQHRPSVRRQVQSVPLYVGESLQIVEWIDTFG